MFFHYLRQHLLLLLKGIAMGAADVVPGVSGGTIAFVTGIYEELIDSIQRIGLSAVRVLYKEGIAACWAYINGNFLLTLLCGILISLVSLSRLITYCLETQPILVWSFFFGLVCASIVYLGRQLKIWNGRTLIAVAIGTVISVAISMQNAFTGLPSEWWVFMGAGAIAICAMILPGISGSYILLLLGLYGAFLRALSEFQLDLLLSFAVGCAIGLMSFTHVLSWLLRRFHDTTVAVLTGFLLGSLMLIWPWKETITTYIDRHGETVPLDQANVLPWQFVGDSHMGISLVLFIAGIILVLGLEKLGKIDKKSPQSS